MIVARIISLIFVATTVNRIWSFSQTGCFDMPVGGEESNFGGFAQACGLQGTIAITLFTVGALSVAYYAWKFRGKR